MSSMSTTIRHGMRIFPRSNCLRRNFDAFNSSSRLRRKFSLAKLLKSQQIALIDEQKAMFDHLFRVLSRMDVDKSVLDLTKDSKSKIDDLYLVVVVGEFNAGKSTFINSLLGKKYLLEGVLPTTNKIHVLRSSFEKDLSSKLQLWRTSDNNVLLDDVEELLLPLDWLQHIAIIDTPGTNAVISRHEILTQNIVPRADLVLFVTSAERPITESESAFLSKITQWGKKVAIILNKMDIVEDLTDRKKVIDFVSQNASKALGHQASVPVFGVSAKHALSAKILSHDGDPLNGPGAKIWEQSGVGIVETYLKSILGEKELVLSKLQNPLAVADRIIGDSLQQLDNRKRQLEGDARTLEFIEDNMRMFESDLDRDLKYYRQQLQDLLRQFNVKIDDFLNENISIAKIGFLFKPDEFLQRFQREVVMDLSGPVDRIVTEVSELVVQRCRTQAAAVLKYIGTRADKLEGAMIGSLREVQFESFRQDMQDSFQRDLQAALNGYQHGKEIESASKSVANSYYQSAGLQGLSVLSLGALMTAQMIDITGITFISSTALLSLLVVPWRSSALRKEFNSKLQELGSRLDKAATASFTRGSSLGRERVMESVAPYSRHVRVETDKSDELHRELISLRSTVAGIKSRTVRAVL